jgi:hypothetical protein
MEEAAKICPECGHEFKGNGFDGIDAHWRANHEGVMPYKDAWPLIKSGHYRRSGGLKKDSSVAFTAEQRKEYERPMVLVSSKGLFK